MKKVLIIDDDQNFAKHLSEKCKEAGIETKILISADEALEYVRNNPVDFIIADFIMPEMDGATFHRIVAHDLKKNIPTIVLTNLTQEKTVEGLEVFVKSETNLEMLVARMKRYLDSADKK